ncbi:Glutamyl-tRNA synthetase Glutamyl-tRNA(Gln) synthetase [Prochlorococcus marinus str. MIT 9321]|uniref:Glutamate--tRNA ligase n=1 Tax=Prochlorococcus marinus str. MIT 9401 TaxID=167551 RepID=A0A0A2B0T2_PROMR|nr:glutamate--tRNA ligase [Prochlorococcus marinus]KGG04089.1 Glutamyl-tRNA synthetase Glutamyl-tRNA(Gln) synthetase [Prochlorococcus marinus str. MIT 9321]KGG04821.1 Glutamyl-tRNA synthetase Glutamyl-tRNA(Gln) synthetase [Prochlorococcus marinus str. MIT 9322]KGG07688.1 Glutamyl-tRNA synthetase Glutamyl-tRNA(Gln) synthetase [Prochlorococcus marinus str. MIT 9401]
MEKRLRLAPSPTGLFHIGTARTALFNWLFAKNIGGKFLIRIEDTDFLRSKSEYTINILEGLKWLGLKWDEEPVKQSNRISIHKKYIKKLLGTGAAYRCFTTEDEIYELREEQKKKGLPPKHDNRHRNLSKEEIETFISQGRTSVIRFKIDEKIQIKWVDLIRGEIKWQGKDLGGDLVLSRRAKGYEIGDPLYNLAVVVDDNFMNITHVVRGEDHISNTAKQILIYEALDFKIPTFSHTPLILNTEGKKLSKRDCVTSIDEFRDMGYLPEALANYMAFLGWSPKSPQSEILSLNEISKIFDLSDVNKAGAKFSWEKLNWINSQYIKNMESVKLSEILMKYWDSMGWKSPSQEWATKLTILIKDSMILLNDSIDQSKPFFLLPQIQKEGQDFLEQNDSKVSLQLILNYLTEQNTTKLDQKKAKEIVNEISKMNNIKKGILMKSLRVAFFGSLSGPDLIQSWELLSETRSDMTRIERCLKSI